MKLEKFFDKVNWISFIVRRLEGFREYEKGWCEGLGNTLTEKCHNRTLNIFKRLLNRCKNEGDSENPKYPWTPLVKLQLTRLTVEWDGLTGHMQVIIPFTEGEMEVRFHEYRAKKSQTIFCSGIDAVVNKLKIYFDENL